ncbi:MAG: lasso peptide biosynthesis B2 protein, partial [Acidobacteriota bacterium]
MEIARKLRDNFNSPQEVLLFGRIFLLITILPLLIKFLTLPRLMKVLSRNASGAEIGNTEDYRNRIIRFTDYLLARNFWIYRKTCLKRTLVLYHFLCPSLRDLGICFGVRERKDASGDKPRSLDGHAWLVHKGKVFLEEKPDVARKYIVTYRFPENPAGRKVSRNNFANLSGENRLLLYCSR